MTTDTVTSAGNITFFPDGEQLTDVDARHWSSLEAFVLSASHYRCHCGALATQAAPISFRGKPYSLANTTASCAPCWGIRWLRYRPDWQPGGLWADDPVHPLEADALRRVYAPNDASIAGLHRDNIRFTRGYARTLLAEWMALEPRTWLATTPDVAS